MVCQVCGTKNPEGSKFCEGCGVELKVAPAETAAPATTTDLTSVASAPAATPATNETAPAVSSEASAVAAAAPVVVAAASESASSTAASSVPEVSPVAASSEMKSTAEAPASSSPDIAAAPAVAATASTPAEASTTPAPAAPVAAAAHSGPQLVARQFGSTTDFVFPLAGQKLSVGRFDPSTGPVDLDLSNLPGKEHVSRRHAELFFENGKWMVRDLGSTNGVYVKKSAESQFGARIQAPVALDDGDEVAFGNVQFVYQAD